MDKDSTQKTPLRGHPLSPGSNGVHPIDMNNQYPPPMPGRPPTMPDRPPQAHSSPSGSDEVKYFQKWVAWLIPLITIANIVMFVLTMYVNNCKKNSISCVFPSLGRFSFQPFSENPLLGPSSRTLEKMGALVVDKVIHKDQGWRLASCMWLHGGVFHILANMLSLVIIGLRMEREFGFVKIGLVYLISGIGGSVFSALFNRSNISVGASGALFGLLGAMLSELIMNWSMYANKFSTFTLLILMIGINLAVGMLPHVDNFAHIGGFMAGFFLGFVFLIRPQFGWIRQKYMAYSIGSTKRKYKIYQGTLWIISLIILIIGFTAGLIMLFRGVDANDHCSWCHYLDCIPNSRWSCNSQPGYCTSEQLGSQINMTCSTNSKSKIYYFANISDSQLQSLCTQLCN